MPSSAPMITFSCHRCTCIFYALMQYLCNTRCSVHSPEVLREEILTAWHCLRAACPSFLLCTVQKVQGTSSVTSCTSNSTHPFLITSPECSDSFTLFTDRYTVLSNTISWHEIEVTLSLFWPYALLFVLSAQRVNTCVKRGILSLVLRVCFF